MAKIEVTQIRSSIKRSQKQKRTLEALGLRKIGHSVTHENSAVIKGMINKINHLVLVSDLSDKNKSSSK